MSPAMRVLLVALVLCLGGLEQAHTFNFGRKLLQTSCDISPACDSFDYGDTKGPDCWEDCWPVCGTGTNQSPIDIDTDTATEVEDNVTPLTFNGFSNAENVELVNKGTTVEVEVKHDTQPFKITGFTLSSTYVLEQFHFHWGSNDSQGSEHLFDGDAGPMEMHWVFFRSDFDDVADAVNTAGGLVVLGFHFEIVDDNNTALDPIVNHLEFIEFPEDEITLTNFVLSSLLPDAADLETAYKYPGSLTTPQCQQTVTWFVFETKIEISDAQLNAFRTKVFQDNDRNPIVNNFRPVQPLGTRTVYKLDVDDD